MKSLKDRKGQTSARNVAVLVLVIGLFMAFYILMLPPEEREKLLEEDGEIEAGVPSTVAPETLLSESPGELFPARERTESHEISPVSLYIKTEPKLILLAPDLVVSKGLFSEGSQTLKFEIENSDLDNLEKAFIYFSVADPKGELKLTINGHVFFSEEISTIGQKIIEIPITYLSAQNELELSTNLFGHYTLSDVTLKEQFELIHSKETRTFVISSIEHTTLESAQLRYNVFCSELEESHTTIKIYLNKKIIHSPLVRCASTFDSVDIESEALVSGKNELMFLIESGDWQFSQIRIDTEGREVKLPGYHFTVDPDDFELIDTEKASVMLEMDISGQTKRARIRINDKDFILDTKGNSFSKDISSYVQEGDNLIKIIPSTEFTADSLLITLK